MRSLSVSRVTLMAVVVTLAAGPAQAATVRWTAGGSGPLWSDPANWSPLQAPVDGDDLLFGGAPASGLSVLDSARSLGSLTFDTTARQFALHVQGDGAAQLAFTGVGIRNLTAGSGPIRQSLFADAGATGGTIAFTGMSGINLATTASVRAVDLTAQGGATAGAVGGHLVFRDFASAGTASFDALRAEGAGLVGATGGEIAFADSAVAGRSAAVTVTGGSVIGASGAQASFAGLARLEGTLNVLSGVGRGASVVFSGSAVAAGTSNINIQGSVSAVAGSEGTLGFRDDARLLASVYNGAGQGAGAAGGLLEFRGRSGHDSLDPSLGLVIIVNNGASMADARGGRTVFRDDAFIVGTQLRIENRADGEGPATGSGGGSTAFLDRSVAGGVTVINQGAAGTGTTGGSTLFGDRSNAQAARITSEGGRLANAPGGALRFSDDATAGSATIEALGGLTLDARGGSTRFADRSQAGGATVYNRGGSVAGAYSGSLGFADSANAGHATIVNGPGQIAGSAGGVTTFNGSSGAGTAFISNDTSLGTGGGEGGRTVFADVATAQQARIDNHGGLSSFDAAFTSFTGRASAGNAVIVNLGGRQGGAFGGNTSFTDNATAGAATFVTAGGGVTGALGGSVVFSRDGSAAGATLDLRAATVKGASGGQAYFYDRASAGAAQVTVQGSAIDNLLGPEGARVTFAGGATGGSAAFTVAGNAFAGSGTGRVLFTGASSAGQATFTLQGGLERGGGLSFEGFDAANLASAGDAHIVNQGSATGLLHGSVACGATSFLANSTAGRATIVNEAGRGVGVTYFFATSRAGDATLDNRGGASPAVDGGLTQFTGSTSAERAMIVNRAGAIGSSGFDAAGRTVFTDQSGAGSARITAEGGSSTGQVGGLIQFGGTTTSPGSATLIAEGGVDGGGGGRIRFQGGTAVSTARIVLGGGASGGTGGSFDISASTNASSVTIGSVEGGGVVNLGARNLTVLGPDTSTTFSGVMGGTGGSLTVRNGATLTLSGANTYTGGTHIGGAVLGQEGKLVAANTNGSATGTGAVIVDARGTLAGSGFIAGPVTLLAGGTIAPGDPVTLTLRDGLTWNGGGLIRLVLGADNAGSDRLNVGTLIHGTDGVFAFELIDAGVVAGQSYDLLGFDSAIGFDGTIFVVNGVAGSVDLANGRLGFTAMAVPEPGTWALLVAGAMVIAWRVRRSRKRLI